MTGEAASGGSEEPSKPLPELPLFKPKTVWRDPPPRARKHAKSVGKTQSQLQLPPNYQRHLRALIAQAATQVSVAPQDGAAASHLVTWDESRRKKWVDAVWKAATGEETTGKGLIEQPVTEWLPGVQRRKDAYKAKAKAMPAPTPVPSPSLSQTQKLKLSAMTPSDRPSTPAPGSGANSVKRPSSPADGAADVLSGSTEAYKEKLRHLPGYVPYETRKWGTAEWVQVDDEFAEAKAPRPTIPGAFPHTDVYTYESSSPPSASFAHPRDPSDAITPTSSKPLSLKTDAVKVVYCMHVPAPPAPPQQSHTRSNSMHFHPSRAASTSSTATIGRRSSELVGSWNRWSSTKTLTSVPSSSTLFGGGGPHASVSLPDRVKVEFWPGRFALGLVTAEAVESDGEEDASEDGMTRSMWSETKNSPQAQPQALSEIIAGAEDDLAPDSHVSLVGGTFVIRGAPTDEDYRRKEVVAVEKMLQILIYSLNAMRLELALLDAYGVPREVSPPPPSVKDTVPESLATATPPGDTLATTNSKKGAKSFLTKLSNDSKAVWGGWLRRKDSKSRAEDALSRVKTRETQMPIGGDTAPHVTQDVPVYPEGDQDSTAAAESVALTSYDRHIQTLHKLQNLKLSTTPGLVFPMPPLLLRIAAEDQQRYQAPQSGSPMRSQGTPATSLHKPRASGNRLGGDVKAGLNAIWPHNETFEGWVRLQGIDFLYSTSRRTRKDTEGINELEGQGDLCLQPHNVSFRYFDPEKDETLGQKLDKLFNPTIEDVCPVTSCAGLPLEHEQSWTHAGICVTLQTREAPLDPLSEQLEDVVEDEVWVECEECGASSEVNPVDEIARLFSWGRYLELIVYHHDSLGPCNICPHKQAPRSWHFRRSSTIIKLSRGTVHVFETRMPKLQVGPNVSKRKAGVPAAIQAVDMLLLPEEARLLVEETRREIEAFYVSVERIAASLKEADSPQVDALDTNLPSLGDIVATCRREESSLYDFLDACHVGQINNARRRFLRRGRAARARLQQLQAHQRLDLPNGWLSLEEPVYFTDKSLHVLPGSSVLVRDDDPSSVIAYTLSSVEYHEELTRSGVQNSSIKRQEDQTAPVAQHSAVGGNDRDASDLDASAVSQLSDDECGNSDDYDTDSWSSEVRRKDTPRDLSLLSIRSLAKKKSDGTLSIAPGLKTPLAPKPQAPSLELSLEQVEGKAESGDRLGDLVRTIKKATARDPGPPSSQLVEHPSVSRSSSATDLDDTSVISVGTVDSFKLPSPDVRRARNSTNDSERSFKSTSMAPPSAFKKGRKIEPVLPASPPGSPSRSRGSDASKDGWSSSMTSTFSNSFSQLLTMGSSVSDTLVGSFKLRSNSGERTSLSSLMGPLSKLSAMDASLSTFDDKPHISFSYTVGPRLKISCTVFYAMAFDSLRRRCAIDRSFVSSLARTSNWEAQGGKSKACFFKTGDDRYIVKELVSKWGASDTHALLEIAPSYFDHLASSHNRATSLAKIVGFYSVQIQDSSGSTSGTKRTLDLLVMENLFHEQKVTRTFDLKGIEGRKVPVKPGPDDGLAPTTLFDGEWLEGQRRSPILLQPHSKRILREAIANDAAFLANQSIMDYSLLLGLDEIRGELVTGIVDAIGSYNLLKTLESRGKLALNRGGDVTIIPPDQYRERFETALKQYFISCPDKWSRSHASVGKRPLTARDVLPSVV